jgi:hypothetical protein
MLPNLFQPVYTDTPFADENRKIAGIYENPASRVVTMERSSVRNRFFSRSIRRGARYVL